MQSGSNLISLLGQPLSHSLSPLIHNPSFVSQGLPLHYFLCPITASSLHVPLDMIRDGLILGSNVTIPHKKNVIPYLDELSPSAQFIQAVNTISRVEKEGKIVLRGDNTDVVGFIKALDGYHPQLENGSILIMGTGGSARAVAFSLARQFPKARIHVSSRTLEKASDFVDFFAAKGIEGIRPCILDQEISESFDLIVNATPLGMHPNLDACPCPPSWKFNSDQIVYDLIYNPQETVLLARAKKGEAVAINGLEMLVQQAAASYVIWTGQEMDLVAVRKTLATEGLSQEG